MRFLCVRVTRYSIDAEVEALLRQRLAAGIHIGIGYGRAKDVKQGQLQPDYLYNAVPLLEELQGEFPGLLTLKVVDTHEKYLVCDRRFAMLGSHNYLASGTTRFEQEVGIWTCDRNVVCDLIERYQTTAVKPPS